MEKIKREWKGFCLLLRSIPSWIVAVFALSLFAMNLLANKSISLPVDWLALDCGIIVSWFAFLTMDIATKHFGPKAATEISVFAILLNLLFCLLLFLGSLIPGVWSESFVEGSEGVIGTALNRTFGGTWYILLGSTVAFVTSAVVNNFSNYGIGKAFKKNPNGPAAYFLRSYGSTAIGQFADNIVFALLVSRLFFGWTLTQCFTCALTGMVAELLFEVVFSPIGYRILKRWQKTGVGEAYFIFYARSSAPQESESERIEDALEEKE